MTSAKTSAQPNFLEDDSSWKDNGCELYSSCLRCPLPRCIEEEPRGRQKLRMRARAERIAELRQQGESTRKIAAMLELSQRTVQRFLKATGGVRHD